MGGISRRLTTNRSATFTLFLPFDGLETGRNSGEKEEEGSNEERALIHAFANTRRGENERREKLVITLAPLRRRRVRNLSPNGIFTSSIWALGGGITNTGTGKGRTDVTGTGESGVLCWLQADEHTKVQNFSLVLSPRSAAGSSPGKEVESNFNAARERRVEPRSRISQRNQMESFQHTHTLPTFLPESCISLSGSEMLQSSRRINFF